MCPNNGLGINLTLADLNRSATNLLCAGLNFFCPIGHLQPMEARHRFGTLTLGLAVIALIFSALSIGSVWATADDRHVTEVYDPEFGSVDITIVSLTADFELKEMESVLTIKDTFFFEYPETFADSKTYEEIAESTDGDVKTTFEEMDRAGSIASLMIWMGLIGLFLTAILSAGSLGQITNSRLTTLSGAFSAIITMLAPIVWYVLLPSSGTYAYVDDSLFGFLFSSDEYTVAFEPSPSYGLMLSVLSGIASIAMVVMIYFHNQADPVDEKPPWMKSILRLVSQSEDDVEKPPTFTERKEQAGRLLKKSFTTYKSNRRMQVASVLIVLALGAYPLYGMISGWFEEEDAYQRDLYYAVYGEQDYITWYDSEVELTDGESLTLSFTEADFPEEAMNRNVIGVDLVVAVNDNWEGDNEETTGVGCVADPGEAAFDTASYTAETPNGSAAGETQESIYEVFLQADLPNFESQQYITGYTLAELEAMYDASDDMVGNYEFTVTGDPEAGEDTFQCERDDASVSVRVWIDLITYDVDIIEVMV